MPTPGLIAFTMEVMKGEHIHGMAGDGPGPVEGRETEDLNVTLLAWPKGNEIGEHVNDEVDVVTVVIAGRGIATMDGAPHDLEAGSVLIIPKGVRRAITSKSEDFRYINIHKRRRRLMPGPMRP